jgi:hypothetical protein
MNIDINGARVNHQAALKVTSLSLLISLEAAYLRYINGEAPLGNILLYTPSSAFLMREDSTKRSKIKKMSPLALTRMKRIKSARTIDEQEKDQFLRLIIYIGEMGFRSPRFRIVSVLVILIVFASTRLLWR